MKSDTAATAPAPLTDLYLRGVIVVLGLTAYAKIHSIYLNPKVLSLADPIFSFLTSRQLLLIAVVIELLALGIVYSASARKTKLEAVSWLAALFTVYRSGLWAMGVAEPCKCLGDALSWSEMSGDALKFLSLAFFFYLCVAPLFLLAFRIHARYRARHGRKFVGEGAVT